MALKFDGRVVVITGAARGIGCATATAFRDEGAEVAEIDKEAGAPFQCDVSDPEEVRAVMQRIILELGRIERGRVFLTAPQIERLHKLIAGEELLRIRRGPAQKGQIVAHCMGQIPLSRVFPQRRSPVPFGKTRSIGAQDHRKVGKFWGFPSQSFIGRDLAGRVR